MALIVEDGTGLAQADSLFSLAEADLYFSERAVPAWGAATIGAKEAAARQAADYLGFAYGWRGERAWLRQRLCWPRTGFDLILANQVPREVREAAMLLALEALSTSLLQERPTERIVESEMRELAGVGRTETRFAVPRAEGSNVPRFANVDALLADLITGLRSARGVASGRAVRR